MNETITTKDAVARIRSALKRRSGKQWSVTHGRGTAYGWITITVPPRERVNGWYMSDDAREELARLLGLDNVHQQGVDIPASHDYYQEYIDRAEGNPPTVRGTVYWD